MRIVAIRGLPDQPGDKQYPREEWIDQSKAVQLALEENKGREEGRENSSGEDQSGDYVVSSALSVLASPTSNHTDKRVDRTWKLR